MNFLAALLILAQMGGAPRTCRYEERPAPNASRTVQAMLDSENPTRAAAERARHYAVMNGDAVGEAQGNFILARIAFETNDRWPMVYLNPAAAACARAGCGPEMIAGLFGWAQVAEPGSPVFQQAVDLALSVAARETIRPEAAADQLLEAERTLRFQHHPAATTAAVRSRALALKILRQVADGLYGRNPVRMASADSRLGDLLAMYQNSDGAAAVFQRAASLWSAAGCQLQSINSLMKQAAALNATKAGRATIDDVLARALSAAETANNRPLDIDGALAGYIEVWKQASPANQKRYLQLRRTLIQKSGDSGRLRDLAQDAEELNYWQLAFDLYTQLLNSGGDNYRLDALSGLARAARKLGKNKEAAEYRKEADAMSQEAPLAGAAATGGGGPTSGDSSRRHDPWKPPERPGKEGGRPGIRPR